MFNPEVVALLRCPLCSAALNISKGGSVLLCSQNAAHQYPIEDDTALLTEKMMMRNSSEIMPVVVIPARYASTRLPGKPLRLLAGIPMIVRTARQAIQSGYPVWVACDDNSISDVLKDEPVQSILTRTDHQNGTERLAEVAEKLGWSDETIVVNVQGDEPLLPPQLIVKVAETLRAHPTANMATLATFFDKRDSPAADTVVKVVCNQEGMALYFSRAAIPYVRDAGGCVDNYPYLRHIGIYAYRVATLKMYPHLKPTPLEQAEKLEQLRFLEHGLSVAVAITEQAPPLGVDCEEDVQRVESVLQCS